MLIPVRTVKTETGDCVVVSATAGVPGVDCCTLGVNDGEGGVVGGSVEGVLFTVDVTVVATVVVTDRLGVAVTEGVTGNVIVGEATKVALVFTVLIFAETGAAKTASTRSRITGRERFNKDLSVIKDNWISGDMRVMASRILEISICNDSIPTQFLHELLPAIY